MHTIFNFGFKLNSQVKENKIKQESSMC